MKWNPFRLKEYFQIHLRFSTFIALFCFTTVGYQYLMHGIFVLLFGNQLVMGESVRRMRKRQSMVVIVNVWEMNGKNRINWKNKSQIRTTIQTVYRPKQWKHSNTNAYLDELSRSHNLLFILLGIWNYIYNVRVEHLSIRYIESPSWTLNIFPIQKYLELYG